MKRQFLEELGLDKEQIDKVMSEYGKGVEAAKGEYAELENKVKETEALLATANEKIKSFEDTTLTIEEIKAEAKEYKEKYEEVESAKNKLEFTYSLKEELEKYNPHDLNDLISYIKEDEVIVKDGKFENLDTIVNELQEKKPHWFKKEEPAKPQFTSSTTGNAPSTTMTFDEFKELPFLEQVKFKQENKEEYDKIIGG